MMCRSTSWVMGVLIMLVSVCWIHARGGEEFGTFGFDIHHRYSDRVKDFLDFDGLPEKGTFDYYAAMAHRDHIFKARRLAGSSPATTSPALTFFGGNITYRLSALGFLHYVFVEVGTPNSTYLVALDTGSDLFWLPCDCTSCVRSLNISGQNLDLNIYSPNASSTSKSVPCNSPICGARRGCSITHNACAYRDVYLSSNTSSTGILVDDVLHLVSDDSQKTRVEAPITLGCGISQTGDFLNGGAPNGLFGLGIDNISVPSILASKGLTANSFAMCFGPDGIGRIDFGDKGSPDQKVTSFNLEQLHPTYNITVTQIVVGNRSTDLEFTAIFDSGTSFTYLNDPAYTVITESFISQITEPRYRPSTKFIFDYCYELSPSQRNFTIPDMNLTMKGGNNFFLNDPIILIRHAGGTAFCLAMVKSENVNIIGQNFMTGYRIVFDREEMVLGWQESDCYDSSKNTLPIGNNTSDAPSPSVFQPQATPSNTPHSSPPSAPSPGSSPPPPRGNSAVHLSSINNKLLVVMTFLFHYFISIYS
ncbi:aspartyl protease family protein 1 isoform X1 [Primulina huaijiensis]|uniref:aspartyl protease family protein 1 isoform X1 n=2 Tax=Primulina huaijiensis TaxID=1492673 RepID=UPI003CC77666